MVAVPPFVYVWVDSQEEDGSMEGNLCCDWGGEEYYTVLTTVIFCHFLSFINFFTGGKCMMHQVRQMGGKALRYTCGW